MKTIHVGGLNPIRRVKTMVEAVKLATHDDVIELHKSIKEGVTVEKDITIHGNGYKWMVPDEKVGLYIDGNVEIKDLSFQTPARANALKVVGRNTMTLENVDVCLTTPTRIFYPIVAVDDTAKCVARECELKGFFSSNESTVELKDCELQSLYPGEVALKDRSETNHLRGAVNASNCKLTGTTFYGTVLFDECDFGLNNRFHGRCELYACHFLPKVDTQVDAKVMKKVQKAIDYSRKEFYTCDWRVSFSDASVLIQDYTPSQDEEGGVGFVCADSEMLIKHVQVGSDTWQHTVFGASDVTFEDVEDASFWSFQDRSTPVLVNSHVNMNVQMKTSKEELDELVGLQNVKNKIDTIMNTIAVNNRKKQTTKKDFGFSNHMIFAGDPGTGKTTVARIVAKALFEIGAVPENKLTVLTVADLVAGYVGQTAEKAQKAIDEAIGGVLFIDEAYGLSEKEGENSFNGEALNVLIERMENHRDDLVVIAAGYTKEMREFLATNTGLDRRFNWIEFEDYDAQEMSAIFEMMRENFEEQYENPSIVRVLPQLFDHLIKVKRSLPDARGVITNGGNGGLVRNVFQRVMQVRNNRLMNIGGSEGLSLEDVKAGFTEEMKETLAKRG